MSLAAIRAANVYYKSKKIAVLSDMTMTVTSNDEPAHCVEGLLGYSDGVTEVKIKAGVIVPVKGTEITALDDMFAKQYVDIGVLVEGSLYQGSCRIMQAEYNSDSKSGMLKGSWEFAGGQFSKAT